MRARRLQPALNTVKRYARDDRPERMLRVPKYRASLADPYREHLRKRRAEDPAVPVKHLFSAAAKEPPFSHLVMMTPITQALDGRGPLPAAAETGLRVMASAPPYGG